MFLCALLLVLKGFVSHLSFMSRNLRWVSKPLNRGCDVGVANIVELVRLELLVVFRLF